MRLRNVTLVWITLLALWPSGYAAAAPRGPIPEEELGVLADRDLAAVQLPLFGTDRKLELGMQAALLPGDAFVLGATYGIFATYHFGPTLGVGLEAGGGGGWETYSSAVLRGEGVRVDAYTPRFLLGATGVWTPIYAKLNLLGRRVVHFDVALEAGAGLFLAERTIYNDVQAADDADRFNFPPSAQLGLLHRYYLRLFDRQVAVRVSARDHLYVLESLDGSLWLKHNLSLGLGAGVFLDLKPRAAAAPGAAHAP